MGLEFSFDDISLDQQVSSEQLEIDLYDELITISDAEPDEQIKMLAAKPASVASHQGNDKPESIRVTGSLGRERAVAEIPATPALGGYEQASMPAAALPLPSSSPNSAPLSGAYPATLGSGNLTAAPPSAAPHSVAPPPSNAQMPVPVRPSPPRPTTAERAPVDWPLEAVPRQARPQPPLPTPAVQAAPTPPRPESPPPPLPARAVPVPMAADTGSVNRCPDCGQPAGDLDMICIECGGFIG